MRALIAKEWRENRLLILGFLVLAPLLSIGVKWGVVGWKDTLANHSVMIVIPGLLLLFVLGIAADLVAGDAGSGRIAFLAALPVRPGTVWAAKAAFLFGAATLYLGYLLLLESAVLTAAGKGAGWLFANFDDRAGYLLAIAAIGAATLFFSTLIDRGLAAVFAGLTALAGIGLLVFLFDPPAHGIRWKHEALDLVAPVAILIGAAFLVGSFLAFARGRIHLGSRVRRIALATAGFLVIAVPPTGWATAALHDWTHIGPDERTARFALESVSPDGRWALVSAGRSGRGPLRANQPRKALFAVRVEDCVVRDLTSVGMLVDESLAWPEPGRITLARKNIVPGERIVWLSVDYDLENGTTLATRPMAGPPTRVWRYRSVLYERTDRGETRVRFPGREPILLVKPWIHSGVQSEWGIGLYGRIDGERNPIFGILDLESGEVKRVPVCPRLLPESRDGEALCRGKGLVRLPLTGGEPRPVPGVTPNSVAPSPNGRWAVVPAKEGVFLFSSRGGEPVRLGDAVPPGGHPVWSPDSKSFLLRGGATARIGRIDRAGLEPFPSLDGPTLPRMSFNGSRAICAHGSRIVVLAADGTIRQLLPKE